MTRIARMTAEPATFERLVVAHQTMVWRYLRFLGCPPADADDLVQDTFVAVLGKALEKLADDEARRYLRKVAKHAWLKRIEREGRAPRVELDVAELAWDWYEREDSGASLRAALDRCLDQLPERSRHALDLKFKERLDRDAIGARLGLGAHAIKSVLARAYARLRTCIEKRLRTEASA